MIQINDISFSYGKNEALKNISFEIHEGEVFGVLGPNGSGKSTLFKILNTYNTAISGDVFYGLSKDQKDKFDIRKKIGVVFQSPSLDLKLSVYENLKFHGSLYGVPKEVLQTKIDNLLIEFGLNDRKTDLVEKLSGGMKRRVEIMKCLLHDPEILILDEPSTGLDPRARRELWDLLLQLNEGIGISILVVTHLMEEAERCHRIAILDSGELVALGSPTELKSRIKEHFIVIQSPQVEMLKQGIKEKFDLDSIIEGDTLKIHHENAESYLGKFSDDFSDIIETIHFHKPTLEDVFMKKTGRSFDMGDFS